MKIDLKQLLERMRLLGLTNHSKVPLRSATMLGFTVSILRLSLGMLYFVCKLVFGNSFSVSVASLVIDLFFFASVQLRFLGIVGEYVGAIHNLTLRRPLVIERERVNF